MLQLQRCFRCLKSHLINILALKDGMTILTSEVRKQKLREVKGLAQGHTAERQLWMFCSS